MCHPLSCVFRVSRTGPLQNHPQIWSLALQGSVSLATFCNATLTEPQGVIPALHVGTVCRMLHLDKDQVAFSRVTWERCRFIPVVFLWGGDCPPQKKSFQHDQVIDDDVVQYMAIIHCTHCTVAPSTVH